MILELMPYGACYPISQLIFQELFFFIWQTSYQPMNYFSVPSYPYREPFEWPMKHLAGVDRTRAPSYPLLISSGHGWSSYLFLDHTRVNHFEFHIFSWGPYSSYWIFYGLMARNLWLSQNECVEETNKVRLSKTYPSPFILLRVIIFHLLIMITMWIWWRC